jgi:hypothetical protein
MKKKSNDYTIELLIAILLFCMWASSCKPTNRSLDYYKHGYNHKSSFIISSVVRTNDGGSIVSLNNIKGHYYFPSDTLKLGDVVVMNYVYRVR